MFLRAALLCLTPAGYSNRYIQETVQGEKIYLSGQSGAGDSMVAPMTLSSSTGTLQITMRWCRRFVVTRRLHRPDASPLLQDWQRRFSPAGRGRFTWSGTGFRARCRSTEKR